MLATLMLIFAILYAVDLVRVNIEGARLEFCGCVDKNDDMPGAVRKLRQAWAQLVYYPELHAASYLFHCLGRVAGVLARRPYIRVPGDEYYMACAADNMHVYQCALTPSPPGGDWVCPSAARG